MSKMIFFDLEARNKMKKGVDTLANAVKVTLGPKGRNVVIEKKFGSPSITKDGVSVAKEIDLEDPIENIGAQMVKEVASKTADQAGDGTTTATVLAQAIIGEGLRNVTAGANPMDLKRGIDKAVEKVVGSLKAQSQTVGNDAIVQEGLSLPEPSGLGAFAYEKEAMMQRSLGWAAIVGFSIWLIWRLSRRHTKQRSEQGVTPNA